MLTMFAIRRLTKDGRSVRLVIPPAMMRLLDLHRGDLVGLAVEDGVLRVTRIDVQDVLARTMPRTHGAAGNNEREG
jgi:antitoxin component of MazEF toxin-antitoxin module